MSSSLFHFEEEKPNHHWRTEIPSIVFELGLNPYEIALYSLIKKFCGHDGFCNKSYKNIAYQLCCGETVIKKSIKKLESPFELLNGKSLIRVQRNRLTEKGDQTTNLITAIDIWNENGNFYKNRVKEINTGGRQTTHPGSPNAYKEEPIKEEPKGSPLKERYPKEKKATSKPKPKKEIPQDPLSLLENDPFLADKMLSPSAKEMRRGEEDSKLFGLTLEKVMSKIKDFFPDTERFKNLRAKFNDLTLYYTALDMEKYDGCRPIKDKIAYLEKLLLDKILNTRNKFRNSYV